jgi:ankyrin repeat protein
MLLDDRFLIYQRNECGQTPLAVAAQRNLLQMARILIKAGSDLNARDINGRGPLYHAVLRSFPEMTNLLIANYASVFAYDYHGNQIMQLTLDPAIKISL